MTVCIAAAKGVYLVVRGVLDTVERYWGSTDHIPVLADHRFYDAVTRVCPFFVWLLLFLPLVWLLSLLAMSLVDVLVNVLPLLWSSVLPSWTGAPLPWQSCVSSCWTGVPPA